VLDPLSPNLMVISLSLFHLNFLYFTLLFHKSSLIFIIGLFQNLFFLCFSVVICEKWKPHHVNFEQLNWIQKISFFSSFSWIFTLFIYLLF
jgi:hypothetical protein